MFVYLFIGCSLVDYSFFRLIDFQVRQFARRERIGVSTVPNGAIFVISEPWALSVVHVSTMLRGRLRSEATREIYAQSDVAEKRLRADRL